MPTHFLHMHQSTYPFGQLAQYDQSTRVIVKQAISKAGNNFNQILRTAKIAKKMSQHNIFVKLETVIEQQGNVCLLYEYVPIRVEKYIKAMDEKFLKQYRNQLYQIADILAQNRIITNVQMCNMGLNQKYQAKYFLGMNFAQKKQVNIYELKNDYVQQIKRIFSPYLNSEAVVVPKKTGKNLVKVDNRLSDAQQIQNVSSYIDSNNNLVKTRKHQSIYYEKDKDKQIKRRKQSYMSSVSNLRLNNLYRRINEIELQVCNTKTSSKNGFKFSIQGREFTSKSSYDNAKKAVEGHKFKAVTNNFNKNTNSGNTSTVVPKNNYVKYPGYENEEQYSEQMSQFQQYQKSIRSNKPNRYVAKNLQMSAHTKPVQKKPYKKFSTQFPSLSDFQQPLMVLTNALRISANGLDKQQKKVNRKIEMFKERQYSEMKSISGNNNYIRDFMSVLEEETSTNQRTSKHNQNEIQSQQGYDMARNGLKMISHPSIQDAELLPNFSQPLYKKSSPPAYSQNAITTYSHSQLPTASSQASPATQLNQTAQNERFRIQSKPSIQQSLNNTNIHSRVKGVIQNSKKLIQKLRQKAKKN